MLFHLVHIMDKVERLKQRTKQGQKGKSVYIQKLERFEESFTRKCKILVAT